MVVGRNGSGKSNFFAAIRFVLSDAYTHMSREERQGLIHEGSGTVMSAYVEIIFDNVDRRLPISKDEVSIRRTIGLKKDDYSLDNRAATRSDIMNLLESAGFSRSNPYYIVPQGKITALTNSKDSERLNLLKDVSGAKVFEAKLKESLKEMENSNMKRDRIDESLKSISERLGDLQLESNDLRKFQDLEKNRKILEFNLFDRELNDLTVELQRIDEKYQEHLQKSNDDLMVLEENEKLVKVLADEIHELKSQQNILDLENEQNKLLYNQTLTEVSTKEVILDELKQDAEASKQAEESLISSIKHYKALVSKTKESIFFLKPKLAKLQNEESTIKNKLIELSTKQRSIYSKQSRFERFTTKSERDEWLENEIERLSKDLHTKEVEITRLTDLIKSKKEDVIELNQKEQELNDSINDDAFQSKINDLQRSINELKLQISETGDKRKSLWRDEIKYKSMSDSLSNDLANANQLVSQTMDRLQSQGLRAVEQITRKLGLEDNVYGPFVNLFSISDKYKTAVEVIAGNSLFHIVVDTDETASAIMEELIREKAGRVTFIPLNRLKVQDVNYPDSSENQCIPLIKKIKFTDKAITPAIQHVFNRTIVCSDLMKGSELAKSYNLTAITLDGDRVDTKGALTGGYRDYKSSRIDAIKIQNKKKAELSEMKTKIADIESEINRVNQVFTDLNNKLTEHTKSLEDTYLSINPIKSEINSIRNKRTQIEQELNSLESSVNSIINLKQNLTTNLQQYQQEKQTEFTTSLSEEELELLDSLKTEMNKHEEELDKVVSKSADLETQLSKHETELALNLRPQLEKLVSKTTSPMTRKNDFIVEEMSQELNRLNEQLKSIKNQKDQTQQRYSEIEQQIEQQQQQLNQLNDKQEKIVSKLEKISKITEKNMNKKAILASRQDEINKKIRDIGVLPEDAFDSEKYEKYESDQLLNQLNHVNEQLNQYSHINKKAIEQYNIFNAKQEELVERRGELEESRSSIEALIESLKLQKHQAIAKSFQLVAKNFASIFEKLVPNGTGKLIMQRRKSDIIDEQDAQEDVDMDNRVTIEDYVGVAISVSFNSKQDEQQRIEQLSGGQKSLCAITLILAIQSCDPAPFYLFDEIDANLDTQYRTAVAAMINVLSDKAQFICTTFRPEMLQVANKFYGVSFNNKVSSVSEITRNDATSFVEGQPASS